ncbi:class I SAM-dependent methyltransferase [Sphingomonas sp. MMS12-HWE2-04]|uniref:class I SAM-dependent methyltransferase n=1 Tax=Sphingomonas sp. MMS12-HWE2-04 TaxID=3234199 RepID=UPI00384FF2BF
MPLDPTDFIRTRLPAAPVPGIPEIRLHKAAPASGLRNLEEQDDSFGSPYWAYHWAGGLALARFVLDRPETVAGRRVLDLGTGAGLVAIAAALAGAAEVIGADTDRYAIAALPLNAALNGVTIAPLHADLTAGDPPAVDLVLVGDLFYDEATAARVTAFLDKCLAAGIDVRIGDPWRAHLPQARLGLLARYEVAESGARTVPSGVFRLHAASTCPAGLSRAQPSG